MKNQTLAALLLVSCVAFGHEQEVKTILVTPQKYESICSPASAKAYADSEIVADFSHNPLIEAKVPGRLKWNPMFAVNSLDDLKVAGVQPSPDELILHTDGERQISTSQTISYVNRVGLRYDIRISGRAKLLARTVQGSEATGTAVEAIELPADLDFSNLTQVCGWQVDYSAPIDWPGRNK